jgi:hypothetical protein
MRKSSSSSANSTPAEPRRTGEINLTCNYCVALGHPAPRHERFIASTSYRTPLSGGVFTPRVPVNARIQSLKNVIRKLPSEIKKLKFENVVLQEIYDLLHKWV